MTHRVDRSLASFPRRTFLKTAALAGLAPLAFALANQDKPKHGRLFVFVGERDMNPGPTDPAMAGLFAIDPDSGLWERIATPKQAGVNSSISPKEEGVIVSARFVPPQEGVWMFELGGDKEPKRIIDKSPAQISPPYWSADGRRLLSSFSIKGREDEAAFETFTFRRDGTGLEKLPLAETDVALAWSPDNRSLLVAAGKDQQRALINSWAKWPIEFINIDGTGRRRLVTEDGRGHLLAVFSPDGRSFAYYDVKKGADGLFVSRLWTVDLESGKRRRLLNDDDHPGTMRWSADGKTLAVALSEYGPNEALRFTNFTTWIELMDLDGKNRRKIEMPFNRPVLCDWR